MPAYRPLLFVRSGDAITRQWANRLVWMAIGANLLAIVAVGLAVIR